jgi:hypothetical protein
MGRGNAAEKRPERRACGTTRVSKSWRQPIQRVGNLQQAAVEHRTRYDLLRHMQLQLADEACY